MLASPNATSDIAASVRNCDQNSLSTPLYAIVSYRVKQRIAPAIIATIWLPGMRFIKKPSGPNTFVAWSPWFIESKPGSIAIF